MIHRQAAVVVQANLSNNPANRESRGSGAGCRIFQQFATSMTPERMLLRWVDMRTMGSFPLQRSRPLAHPSISLAGLRQFPGVKSSLPYALDYLFTQRRIQLGLPACAIALKSIWETCDFIPFRFQVTKFTLSA